MVVPNVWRIANQEVVTGAWELLCEIGEF